MGVRTRSASRLLREALHPGVGVGELGEGLELELMEMSATVMGLFWKRGGVVVMTQAKLSHKGQPRSAAMSEPSLTRASGCRRNTSFGHRTRNVAL